MLGQHVRRGQIEAVGLIPVAPRLHPIARLHRPQERGGQASPQAAPLPEKGKLDPSGCSSLEAAHRLGEVRRAIDDLGRDVVEAADVGCRFPFNVPRGLELHTRGELVRRGQLQGLALRQELLIVAGKLRIAARRPPNSEAFCRLPGGAQPRLDRRRAEARVTIGAHAGIQGQSRNGFHRDRSVGARPQRSRAHGLEAFQGLDDAHDCPLTPDRLQAGLPVKPPLLLVRQVEPELQRVLLRGQVVSFAALRALVGALPGDARREALPPTDVYIEACIPERGAGGEVVRTAFLRIRG